MNLDDVGSCTARGVLELIPPPWADAVEITFSFDNTTTGFGNWAFNLGDSISNDGYCKHKEHIHFRCCIKCSYATYTQFFFLVNLIYLFDFSK